MATVFRKRRRTQIVKSFINSGHHPDIYYYRDMDQKEVDLIIVREGKIWLVEIKKNKVPDHPDKNFSVLKKFGLDVRPGVVLCLSDQLVPMNRDAWLCPVSVL